MKLSRLILTSHCSRTEPIDSSSGCSESLQDFQFSIFIHFFLVICFCFAQSFWIQISQNDLVFIVHMHTLSFTEREACLAVIGFCLI